ncbi:MAG: hypothetical protein Q8P93_01115 [bacterium]|nr:hypothetical protein [bacterium]
MPYSAKECFSDTQEVTHVRDEGLLDASDKRIA